MSLEKAEEFFDSDKFQEAKTLAELALKNLSSHSGDEEQNKTTKKQLQLLIRKCNLHCSTTEAAQEEDIKPKEEAKKEQEEKKQEAKSTTQTASAAAPTTTTAAAPLARHEWYQSATHLTFTFYVKKRQESDVTINADKRKLEVKVKINNDDEKEQEEAKFAEWYFEPLFMEIDHEKIEKSVSPYKIEVKVPKKVPSQWPSLELKSEVSGVAVQAPVDVLPKNQQELSYPNSKNKDWNKVAIDEDDDEKKSGDEALSGLFKKIYSNADEDTRRAMMKSYQESGGTTLSTNWSNVGKDFVRPEAPNGMEVRNWNEDSK